MENYKIVSENLKTLNACILLNLTDKSLNIRTDQSNFNLVRGSSKVISGVNEFSIEDDYTIPLTKIQFQLILINAIDEKIQLSCLDLKNSPPEGEASLTIVNFSQKFNPLHVKARYGDKFNPPIPYGQRSERIIMSKGVDVPIDIYNEVGEKQFGYEDIVTKANTSLLLVVTDIEVVLYEHHY